MNIIKKTYSILFSALILVLASNVFIVPNAYCENSSSGEEHKSPENKSEVEICNLKEMKARYIGEDNEESLKEHCWYCRIVVMMTNAYLKAANSALSVSQELGHVILKLGFSIWLALYILKQVSSLSPTSPGKMLQEILVMGFKCAFANFAISDGISFISAFFLNPIMLTGTDIGQALLSGLLSRF